MYENTECFFTNINSNIFLVNGVNNKYGSFYHPEKKILDIITKKKKKVYLVTKQYNLKNYKELYYEKFKNINKNINKNSLKYNIQDDLDNIKCKLKKDEDKYTELQNFVDNIIGCDNNYLEIKLN